jgi:hypothetical protein
MERSFFLACQDCKAENRRIWFSRIISEKSAYGKNTWLNLCKTENNVSE